MLLFLVMAFISLQQACCLDTEVVVLRAVRGQDARLPCGQGKVFLDGPDAYVLWLKNDREFLYRFPNEETERRSLTLDQVFGTTCVAGTCHDDTSLLLKRVSERDGGIYRCRVHYQASPAVDYVIEIRLVDSPGMPRIYNDAGEPLKRGHIQHLSLGANLTLTCEVDGGHPDTLVFWRRNGVVVERAAHSSKRAVVRVRGATRAERDAHYECLAQNADVSEPLSASVLITMYLPPLSVEIRLNNNVDFEAGQPRVVDCVVVGCVPPPSVTWHLGDTLLRPSVHKELHDGNYTVSSLTLAPSLRDNGRTLACRAHNSHLPAALFEDKVTLNVGYRPVCLTSGDETIGAVEREAETVTCVVEASPEPMQFSWTFADSRTLYTSVKGSKTCVLICISVGLFLAILTMLPDASASDRGSNLGAFMADDKNMHMRHNYLVQRALDNDYMNHFNYIGPRYAVHVLNRPEAEPLLNLIVDYANMMRNDASLENSAQTVMQNTGNVKVKKQNQVLPDDSCKCEERSESINLTKDWGVVYPYMVRNSTCSDVCVKPYKCQRKIYNKVPGHQHRYTSTLTWLPRAGDAGPLLCRATNPFGEQKRPCSYAVITGGAPESPECVILRAYPESLRVQCKKGWDGGRPQTIHLTIRDGGTVLHNVSDAAGHFHLRGIGERNLSAAVYASNSRGRSQEVMLHLQTAKPLSAPVTEETPVRPWMRWLEAMAGAVAVAATVAATVLCARALRARREPAELNPDLVPRSDGSFHREPDFVGGERVLGTTNITVNQLASCQNQYSSSPVPSCRVLVGCPHPSQEACPATQHSYFV